MNDIKVGSFIAGDTELYNVIREYPDLRRVPIKHITSVREGLKRFGYNFRIRYRGPHRPQHDTLKQDARAFTVYIYESIE